MMSEMTLRRICTAVRRRPERIESIDCTKVQPLVQLSGNKNYLRGSEVCLGADLTLLYAACREYQGERQYGTNHGIAVCYTLFGKYLLFRFLISLKLLRDNQIFQEDSRHDPKSTSLHTNKSD
jgi:hypothetical protein